MAKEKEVAGEVVETKLAKIETENGKVIDTASVLASLDEAEIGDSLNTEYFTIEPGETTRVIFTGMTEMNKMGSKTGEMTDAVNFVTKEGKSVICADKVIVSACKRLHSDNKNPVALQIVCTGKTKGQNGTYKEFEINKLNLQLN